MKVKVDETCSRGTESGFSLPWWEGNGSDEARFQSSLWGIPERRKSHQGHEMIRIWGISQHILGGGHLDKKIMNLVSSKVSWVSDAFQLLLQSLHHIIHLVKQFTNMREKGNTCCCSLLHLFLQSLTFTPVQSLLFIEWIQKWKITVPPLCHLCHSKYLEHCHREL